MRGIAHRHHIESVYESSESSQWQNSTFLICDLWQYDRSAEILALYLLYLDESHLRIECAFT